jgi:mannosyltransferase
VALAAGTAALLAAYQLGLRSFWLDEADSVTFAKASMTDLLTLFNRNTASVETLNMSLYYVVLHFWLAIGETEARVRLLSVLFGIATVMPVFLVGRRLAGRRGGALAAFVYATSAFTLRYDQEARAYTLFMLASISLTWLLLRADSERSWQRWLVYGVVAGVGLYIHFFMVFVLLSHLTWLIATRSLPPLRQALAAAVPIAIAAVPLPFNILANPNSLSWIQPLRADTIGDVVQTLAGNPVAALALVGLAGVAVARRGPQSRALWLIAAAAAVPMLAIVAISLAKPLLVGRYLAASVPPLAILAGVGLSTLRSPRIRSAAILGYAVLAAATLVLVYARPETEDWRDAGAWVAQSATQGDAIIYRADSSATPMGYYLERAGASIPPQQIDVSDALRGTPASRVWYVVRISADDPSTDIGRLRARYTIAEARRFGSFVRVYLLRPIT